MQIRYLRATWGMTQSTLGDRLRKIRDDGFDGVETGIPVDEGERRELGKLLEALGLVLVAQQWTQGRPPGTHRELRGAVPPGRAARALPRKLPHGQRPPRPRGKPRDLPRGSVLEEELGVPVLHEVHRGRATFSTVSTVDLLDNLPGLKLTADFSHWCCVHESLLEDQHDRLERAIDRSFHIHARVGHPEGPQVSDPRAPEWAPALEAHLGWWQESSTSAPPRARGSSRSAPSSVPPTTCPRCPGPGSRSSTCGT